MSLDYTDALELQAELNKNIDGQNWNSVALIVKEAIKRLSHDDGRKVSSEILDELAHALHAAARVLHDKQSPNVITAVTECFRFLRNACALHSHVQKSLDTAIFNGASELLCILCNGTALENNLLCVKTIVQFIGNAVVGNQRNQIIVWELLHSHLKELLSSSDASLINYTYMVLYNILIGELDEVLKYIIANISVLLQCYSNGSEFAMFVVEYVLAKESLLEEIYLLLEMEHRLQILDAILSLLVERANETKEKVNFPVPNVLFLVSQLKQRADCVLTIVEEGMTAEPRETLRLLDVLACASSRLQYLPSLQSDCSLIISVACLLKNVNEIGKFEGGNVFSSVQRLSEMKSGNESVQNHPLFGFKVSLVRLIGNLCHQHVGNQNQVRELNCLPAVLDTCNIDVYNPLLLQWGVLAVRNLLENNVANQEIVAGLVARGPASNTVLHELGMELHQDEGGSLHIAPLKRM